MAQPKTAKQFILRGLCLPLSEENLMLAFKPGRFFRELSKISGYSEKTLQDTASRAKRDGLLVSNGNMLELTEKGRREARPFVAQKLSGEGKLLIVFDIPEERAKLRHEFRRLLKELDFVYVQRSVWVSEYDHREVLLEAIDDLELDGCVAVYEAARLFE